MLFGLTNDTTYLTGNEGQNFVGFSLKMLRCKARALPANAAWSAILSLRKMRMRLYYANSTGPACSVYLEGTTTRNEGRVSTPACIYILL